MNIVVLGSGAWGTALAMAFWKNRHGVTLWSHNESKALEMAATRENPLLKGISIPREIAVTGDLNCLHDAEVVVFAAPSFALRSVAHAAAPYLPQDALLMCVTKGIEQKTHFRMSQIVAQETGGAHRIVVLSGPSHAEEVAKFLPTGCVAASESREAAVCVQRLLTNDCFRIYTHDDVIGVELAGALKNVTALCCGISDGFGLGDNTKAMLMTRAMAETSRLAERLGGRKQTFAGLAGMGDLIVTCTSMHSRNRRAGIAIGQGEDPARVVAAMGGVVEGYYAAISAKELGDSLGIELPICFGIFSILYEGAQVASLAKKLMSRTPTSESDCTWV